MIGSIDPATMAERDAGLYVEGKLDIDDSEVAREAWRSVKGNAVGLSFGYLVKSERDGSDGVRELLELDLFEISLTPAPANPDTRVLSTKSVDDFERVRQEARDRILNDLAAVKRSEPDRKSRPIEVKVFEC